MKWFENRFSGCNTFSSQAGDGSGDIAAKEYIAEIDIPFRALRGVETSGLNNLVVLTGDFTPSFNESGQFFQLNPPQGCLNIGHFVIESQSIIRFVIIIAQVLNDFQDFL